MKRYTVNVHYDAVVTVVVEAEDEEQALDLAPTAAESISLEDAEVVDINSCVIYVEEISDISEVTQISYKGESYTCRVLLSNEGERLIIASTKLYDKLAPSAMADGESEFADKEAEMVDEQIFYYVSEQDLKCSDKVLKEIVAEANPDWFD